jgi:hypothetical protein
MTWAHLGLKVCTHVHVEAAKEFVPSVHQRHIATKALEYSCELHRDVPTTDHQYPLGQLLEVEGFI